MATRKSSSDEWDTFFTYDLKFDQGTTSKGEVETNTKYRISLKTWKKTQGVSIHVQKIVHNCSVGNGVYFRAGDLSAITNKLSELNVLSNPKVIEETNDESQGKSRRIDMKVHTTLPKNLTIVLITLAQEGKQSENLDIPLPMCDAFANVLSAVANIILVRKMSSDELKISDILTFLAVRYRSQYAKQPKTQFAKDMVDIYKSLSKLLLFKTKNPEADLKAVPFKDISISLEDMICIQSSCLDWLLVNFYGSVGINIDQGDEDSEEEGEEGNAKVYESISD